MKRKDKKDKKIKKSKKKIILIILLIVTILVLILGGIGYYLYHDKLKKVNLEIQDIEKNLKNTILNFDDILEYGTSWPYEEFLNKYLKIEELDDVKVKLMVDSKELKEDSEYLFDTVGEIKVNFELEKNYKYKIIKEKTTKIKVSKELKLKVEDTKSPEITGYKDKTITVGDKIDLKSGIKASDLVDGEIEFKIDGTVDTKKAGTYKIKIIATDKNGNETTKEFTVTVNEKKTTTSSGSQGTTSKKSSSSNKSSSSSGSSTSTVAGRLSLAKAEAKRVVAKIIKPGMSDYDKANAIMMYIYENVDVQTNQSAEAYKKNYGNEAYAALVLKIAACSGRCKAVTLLCDAAGLKSQHVNKDLWTHQWNKVLIDGKWIILDSQAGILGGEKHPLEE